MGACPREKAGAASGGSTASDALLPSIRWISPSRVGAGDGGGGEWAKKRPAVKKGFAGRGDGPPKVPLAAAPASNTNTAVL
jgi:hypothetical protein